MAAIARDNCINSNIAARNYPQLALEVVGNGGASIVWQACYELVNDASEQIALLYGVRDNFIGQAHVHDVSTAWKGIRRRASESC